MPTIFRKSRNRIVAAIMAVLFILLVGTLAVIFIASYTDMEKNNYDMLKSYSEKYTLFSAGETETGHRPPEGPHNDPMKPGGKPFEDTPYFRLSTFYSVALDYSGGVIETDAGDGEIYSEEALASYAREALEGGKEKGTRGSLIYLVTDKGDFTLVAFMDNTVLRAGMSTVFGYTLVFGSVLLVLLFALAVYLAGRIVRPLEESYRKQKQFISDAGHELKTPVAVVSANSELLQREIGENKWLSNIQYENERMKELVKSLLELARAEDVKAVTERLELGSIIESETLPFESVAFEKGLEMKLDIARNVYIDGNVSQIGQLVSILTDNAVRHGRGRSIDITLAEKGNSAVLTVINEGDPIPPEERERLFERFYRTDEARGGEHYGLGLAIAKAITVSHRGRIDVASGDGKVYFTVKLPRVKGL